MPAFASGIAGRIPDKKLNIQELIHSIRQAIATENEATVQYQQLSESTDNILAKAVLKDIANEERVHIGELIKLLTFLDPDEKAYYAKGVQEVESKISKK